MKKTVTIHLAGSIFHIDEDAYETLQEYLHRIQSGFSTMEGNEELMDDIESRLSELFLERLSSGKQVITLADVEAVKAVFGRPEDLGGDPSGAPRYSSRRTRHLYRDTDHAIIGGVCSGLAAHWQLDPSLVRIVFVILAVLGMAGMFLYLILWIIIPEAHTVAQKLEMRGDPVNLSNIGAFFREEFENVKRSFRKK